jgi:hypothetical protein
VGLDNLASLAVFNNQITDLSTLADLDQHFIPSW